MRLGLSSYSYGWAVGTPGSRPVHALDELGLLDRCQEHGLRLLQVGDNLPLHTLDSARLARFLDRACAEGVELEEADGAAKRGGGAPLLLPADDGDDEEEEEDWWW